MLDKLRRKTQLALFGSASLLLVALFQNCGPTTPTFNPLFDGASQATCIGFSCSSEPSAVELKVPSHVGYIAVRRPSADTPSGCEGNDSRCFDVAGYCEVAGYPDSRIFVELRGPTGFPERQVNSKCDELGRFRVLVQLPSNYDYNTAHQLLITLRAIDSRGRMIENPRRGHIHSLQVISY